MQSQAQSPVSLPSPQESRAHRPAMARPRRGRSTGQHQWMGQGRRIGRLGSALAGASLLGLLIAGCGSPRAASGTQAEVRARPYPLDTCLVTENALGSMGDPVTLVHAGQEIKLCCAPCVEEFKAHPETYLSRLE